ncbi:MAG: gamma-glutamyltransferase family protein [Dehalococcoidia bacterium]
MTHAENLPFRSRRAPVRSLRGSVATSQPLAAQAGLEILMTGGNAADAAVATAAALAVTEPTGTGPGGDCFALFYESATRRVRALNGSGRAPAALSIGVLADRGIEGEIPLSSPHAVTVPGTVAGWEDTLAEWGTLAFVDVLRPAIRLAEEGFPVSGLIAAYWAEEAAKLRLTARGSELLKDGRAPRAGEIWRNPGLAGVLRTLCEGGAAAFYEGDPGRAIVRAVREAGGLIEESDLADHESTLEEPLHTTYRGVTAYACPPNGQGLATLLSLNILEGFELAGLDPLSAEHLHYSIEAMRLGFADARWHVADPAVSDQPVAALLSKEYGSARRVLIDPRAATLTHLPGEPNAAGSDTVYLAVVDREGNACSFINSNYAGVGTGIVPEGMGFPLQNRGANFSLDPGHPNALAGRKRPYHTIMPGLATDASGELFACFGVKGGFMQPQGQLQVLVNLVDHRMDPQDALDRPRFCLRPALPSGDVALEVGIPVETMHALARMGHRVIPSTDRFLFGTGQVILRDPAEGAFWAGSDPRADGAAVGW